jgi:hypothetical protein
MFLLVAAGLAAAVVVLVVRTGRRRGTLLRSALAAVVAVAVTWGLALALMSTGWKDVDGWIDCNDACHGWHYMGAFLFWTPPIAGLLLVLVAAYAALARRGG